MSSNDYADGKYDAAFEIKKAFGKAGTWHVAPIEPELIIKQSDFNAIFAKYEEGKDEQH